jgi:hypothetical protein
VITVLNLNWVIRKKEIKGIKHHLKIMQRVNHWEVQIGLGIFGTGFLAVDMKRLWI